jgi:outer membrane immunogenic protein
MLKLAAALTVGLFASATAMAADLPNGSASPGLMRAETAYNWSGIYAGASAAMAWDEITADNARSAFGTAKAHGFLGSLQAGFNKQAGSLVLGLEIDVSLSNAHGEVNRTGAGTYGLYTLSGAGALEARITNLGTVRARVGYAVDNVLFYGTLGYAVGRQQLQMSGPMTATLGAASSTAQQAGTTSNSMSGLVFGGGVEYAFARGVSLKAEYLRVQFTSSNFFSESWATTPTRANLTLMRTGVNFRI